MFRSIFLSRFGWTQLAIESAPVSFETKLFRLEFALFLRFPRRSCFQKIGVAKPVVVLLAESRFAWLVAQSLLVPPFLTAGLFRNLPVTHKRRMPRFDLNGCKVSDVRGLALPRGGRHEKASFFGLRVRHRPQNGKKLRKLFGPHLRPKTNPERLPRRTFQAFSKMPNGILRP